MFSLRKASKRERFDCRQPDNGAGKESGKLLPPAYNPFI